MICERRTKFKRVFQRLWKVYKLREILASFVAVFFIFSGVFQAHAGGGSVNPVYDMDGYWWLDDDASGLNVEDNTGFGAGNLTQENHITSPAVQKNSIVRLRVDISETANQTVGATIAPRLEFQSGNVACTAGGTWTTITTSTSNAWALADSTTITDGDSTDADRISGNAKVNQAAAGTLKDTNNPAAGFVLDNKAGEWEFSIKATTAASDNQVYTFRITNNGTVLNNYSLPTTDDCPNATTAAANTSPTVNVDLPAADTDVADGSTYQLQYDLADTEDAATVDFYYETDGNGAGGTAISACQNLGEATNGTCSFNPLTEGMSLSTYYYIYGVASDGVNPDVVAVSAGRIRVNDAPTLTVSQPDGTSDTIVQDGTYSSITYALADTDSTVTVDFYYDTDGSGLDGTAITGCQNQSEAGTTCAWDTTSVAAGTYYIYGRDVTDGVNAEVWAYSPGVVTINDQPAVGTVSDAPDPVEVGSDVTFSTGTWTDDNASETIKMFVCKTDALTSQATGGCSGGAWYDGSGDSYVATNPLTKAYTAQAGDVGINNYYVFICDAKQVSNSCSTSGSGTFEVTAVNNPPTLTVSDPDGTSDSVGSGGLYPIVYTLTDDDSVATVSFYYDTDGSGLDGTAISGCADQAEGTDAVCYWDTNGLANVSYYVYGVTSASPSSVDDYSPGVVTIGQPTEFVSIIDPGNGSGTDYTTLSLWEAADADLTSAATKVYSHSGKTGTIANLASVTGATSGATATVVHASATQILLTGISGRFQSGEQVQVDVSNYVTLTNAGTSAIAVASARSSNGSADTTAVTIDGWTTDSDNYIKIWTDPTTGARHNGKWDDNVYRMEYVGVSGTVDAIRNFENYVTVDGIQIKLTDAGPGAGGINFASSTGGIMTVKNVIVRGVLSGTSDSFGIGLNATAVSATLNVINSVVYDFINGAYATRAVQNGSNVGTLNAYNSTVHNSYYGFRRVFGTFNAKNCGAASSTNPFDGTIAQTNCSSSTPTFVDEAGDDFHLAAGDTTWKDAGTDLSSTLTDDIDGSYRGNAFDIGADEVPTDFVKAVCENTSAGGDCATSDTTTLSAWEADVQTDLTAATTRVYSGSLTGSITDGATVTLYRGGASQSITAMLVAKSTTQILLSGISGTVPLNVQANDEWRVDASNLWTVTGTLDDLGASPIAVAKIDGAWSAADTTAVEINGWTTSADNYIKIYTTAAARHNGKWDDNKYRLYVNGGAGTTLDNYEDYTRIIGLQVQIHTFDATVIGLRGVADEVGYSIIVGNSTAGGGGIDTLVGAGKKIYNNILYNHNTAISNMFNGSFVYNNTAVNNYYGFYGNAAEADILKNNIAYNNTDNYFSSFHTSSTNNLSGPSQSDAPGTNPQNDKTVQFVDAANGDFHLAQADTAAQNAGVDLSADANLKFSDDIDGDTRPNPDGNTWDIGADEYYPATPIYRSVAPGATGALDDDNTLADTLTISGSTATFEVAVADNVGVGDVIIYDDDADNDLDASDTIVFIHGRNSSTNYTVKDADGTDPDATTTDNDKWAIYRAYTSLWDAEAGSKNTSIPITFTGGNRDLVSNNEQWNIAAYAGATADATAVTINGWTTGPNNYIKIYTPVSATEVGTSQRHPGKWDDTKYALSATDTDVLLIQEDYVEVNGLQVKLNTSSTVTTYSGIKYDSNTGAGVIAKPISNSIIWGNLTASGSTRGAGIFFGWVAGEDTHRKAFSINNIIKDFIDGSSTSASGIMGDDGWDVYVYSTTVHNSYYGIRDIDGDIIVKNSLVYASTDAFIGSYAASSDYNLVGPSGSDAPGANSKQATSVAFIDENGDDFHLSPSDTGAKNFGVDLSNDANLAFSTDIDGQSRLSVGSWDIGADEAENASTSTPTSPDSGIGIGMGVNLKPGTNLRGGVWACGQDLVDSRDSKSYKTVAVGDQCWMKQGLNVGTRIAGGSAQGTTCTNAADIEKWCYDNTDANCDSNLNPKYPDGGLYQWDQAMCGSATEGAQGICPTGWHLPTHDEYTDLERAVCTSGSCATDFPYDTTTQGWRGTDEGTKLKPGGSSGWEGNLAGIYDGGFGLRVASAFGFFWSSTEFDASNAWNRYFNLGTATVGRAYYGKVTGYSVRCLKD